MPPRWILFFATLALAGAPPGLGVDAPRADVRNTNIGSETAAALPQRAYLWQRAWTPEMPRDLLANASAFAGLDVLAAEIDWRDGAAAVHRVELNAESLRQTRRSLGLVVRIGPTASAWSEHAPETRAVLEACRHVLADARRAGIEPSELQLDFDAATARLASYRGLLQLVKREVRPPRLVITALPDWLRSGEFAALVRETDGYVLQVHSLEKPAGFDAPFTLCDPVPAMRWIEQASARGHPFRVALPAYGYRLIFEATGKFVALEAETSAQPWPASHRTKLALADPAKIAPLVAQLLASPPRACEGLVWFRFPHAHDELAWSGPTLRAVMQGRVPRSQLDLIATPAASGARDLTVVNSGETSVEPHAFRLAWQDARLLAVDPLAGWQIERDGPHAAIVRPPPHASNGLLRPGDRLRVGWLRLTQPVPLAATPLD